MNKRDGSFIRRTGLKSSAICFSCWKEYSIEDIIKKISVRVESGCLLWPDLDRDDGYYHKIRRGFASKEGKYIYARCHKACVNKNHFFYFDTKPPTWWLAGFDSEEPLKRLDCNLLSSDELLMMQRFLSKRVSTIENEKCWFLIGDAINDYVRVDYKKYYAKNLFFYIYSGLPLKKGSVIVSNCENEKCLNPLHQTVYSGPSALPFWMKNGLKKPRENFAYCQNKNCNNFGVEIDKDGMANYDSRKSSSKRFGRPVCLDCFDSLTKQYKIRKSVYDKGYAANNKQKRMIIIERWSKSIKCKVSSLRRSHLRRAAGRIDKSFLEELFIKYNECCYCNRRNGEIPDRQKTKRTKFELEHITPIALGGANDISNLEIACWQCNSSKQDLSINDWVNKLKNLTDITNNECDRVYYKLILKTLSDENAAIDKNFKPRHMRTDNA